MFWFLMSLEVVLLVTCLSIYSRLTEAIETIPGEGYYFGRHFLWRRTAVLVSFLLYTAIAVVAAVKGVAPNDSQPATNVRQEDPFHGAIPPFWWGQR
jgi:hypothetical protein